MDIYISEYRLEDAIDGVNYAPHLFFFLSRAVGRIIKRIQCGGGGQENSFLTPPKLHGASEFCVNHIFMSVDIFSRLATNQHHTGRRSLFIDSPRASGGGLFLKGSP